ncbi:MAG TPA: hypothetical protein ENJ40_07715 [Thermosulfurimonas dismutans]|uniref:PKD domain-containing protein n=1 Tax=Thermosulfurimonas dismutans TaxID=999894 RepID=A0A7C3H1R4_9BACT|nr:hypothetical protein [Thermosulfurimonas dismutans]
MRRIGLFLIIFLGLLSGVARAITVTASPTTANVGDTINVTATATFLTTPSCTLRINFGDGSGWSTLGNCVVSPCTLSTSHVYSSAGTFTITVESDPVFCATPPNPPDPATTTVNILSPLTVTGTVSPSAVRVPRGETSVRTLTYTFRASAPTTLTLTSSQGVFKAGATVLGRVSRPISVTITGRTGTATETLTIPVAVLRRALSRGITTFTYERTFTGGPSPITTTLNITITTEALAGFQIKRLELYFPNGRGEITVPRHHRGLRAYARVRYTGSGPLRAYWEVDGRLLSYVQRELVYAGEVVFETPPIPPLPTFDPGTHVVRFVIEDPRPAFELPSIVYFVTAREKPRVFPLALVSPENGTVLDYGEAEFRWKARKGLVRYLIEFYKDPRQKPVFSAYTRVPYYRLSAFALKHFFSREKRYYWRVHGFDAEGQMVAESPIWSFGFREERAYLPQQVLVVFRKKDLSEERLKDLRRKYNLKELFNFSLRSLGVKVYLFRTTVPYRDIPELSRRLSREAGVFLSQPNFIFYTFSEPLFRHQVALRMFHPERLHRFLTGRGVRVAVVDTGVDFRHRDLEDRVVLYLNFIPRERYRAEVHGTAVAGIIAASENGFGILGLAPEAEILALRACRELPGASPRGECYSTTLARALDRALTEKAQVINLSLGRKGADPLLARLLDRARSLGVLVVAPVGYGKRPAFPASHPGVIAVGSLEARGTSRISGEAADLLAPAEKILTTVPGNRHNFLSGTSFSAAFVSGLLALAEEGYRDRIPEKLLPEKGKALPAPEWTKNLFAGLLNQKATARH